MNKYVLRLLFVIWIALVGTTSCKGPDIFTGNPETVNDDIVLTIESNVKPEILSLPSIEGEVIKIPESVIPKDIKENFPEESKFVLTENENLIKESPKINLAQLEEHESIGDVLQDPETWSQVAGFAGVFIPGLAGLEGLLTLFFRRKKQHYGNAAKRLAKGDIGGALSSVVKALGATHTDQGIKAEKTIING